MSVSFQVGDIHIGSGDLFLIAGPCVIESEEHAIPHGGDHQRRDAIARVPVHLQSQLRQGESHIDPQFPRARVQRRTADFEENQRRVAHSQSLTDVHETADVAKVAEVADVLQIPAFLSRQTDLVVAAALSGRAVNIKKGQFVAPWDMRHAVEKCRQAGNAQVFLTERGASFGYNNLVVDMRSLAIMRKFAPVVFDATHSVQLPSSQSDEKGPAVSGGQPEFIPLLARAAVAAGVDGVFMEVHDNPKEAKSDGANALESTKLRGLLKELLAVKKALAEAHATP